MDITSHSAPPSPCPKCREVQTHATNFGDSTVAPYPGALSVCWSCGAPLRFAKDLTLRSITTKDRLLMGRANRRQIDAAVAKWQRIHERRRLN